MPIGTTAAILGGVSAAGSLASGLGSVFGDDEDSGPDRGSRIRQIFEERYDRLRETSPTETEGFEAGLGALREQSQRQAETDEEQAAARGLEGSQFALAQDASRAEALANSTRNLVRGSAQGLQQRRQSALAGLLDAEQLGMQEDQFERELESRRQSRLGQIAGTGLQAATQFALAGQEDQSASSGGGG